METLGHRKNEHLELARKAQLNASSQDSRFSYEPLFGVHTSAQNKYQFLNWELDFPFIISSMTGGSEKARFLNNSLAHVAAKLNIIFGLGSCRSLLESDDRLSDFDFKSILGKTPLLANIGIAQLEALYLENDFQKLESLITSLSADGLIVHVNPLQEHTQLEGDKFSIKPVETIQWLREKFSGTLIVKEVGQGFGKKSLSALIYAKVDCIDLAGLGGTNFTKLESLRSGRETCFAQIGHSCEEMIAHLNELGATIPIIISGGVKSPLDAYYLRSLYKGPSIIGQASMVLSALEKGAEQLELYLRNFFDDYKVASEYLEVRN